MTWNHNCDSVSCACVGECSQRLRFPDSSRHFTVRFNVTIRDRLEIIPHAHLESRRADVQREIQMRLFPSQVICERSQPSLKLGMRRFNHRFVIRLWIFSLKRCQQLIGRVSELHKAHPPIRGANHDQTHRKGGNRNMGDFDTTSMLAILIRRHSQSRIHALVNAAQRAVAGSVQSFSRDPLALTIHRRESRCNGRPCEPDR
jgi:hypothetical protein